jgi:hypothetical protein
MKRSLGSAQDCSPHSQIQAANGAVYTRPSAEELAADLEKN